MKKALSGPSPDADRGPWKPSSVLCMELLVNWDPCKATSQEAVTAEQNFFYELKYWTFRAHSVFFQITLERMYEENGFLKICIQSLKHSG